MSLDANIETSRPAFITDSTAYAKQVDVDLSEVGVTQTQIGEEEEVLSVGTNVKDGAEAASDLSMREGGGKAGLNNPGSVEEQGNSQALFNAKNDLYATMASIVSNRMMLEQFTSYMIQVLQAMTRPSNTKQTEQKREEKDEEQGDS
jgi:hypothetical protein